MANFSQSGSWRRRRRHDILLDGCGVLAALISFICCSVFECACLCNSRRQRVSPISEDSRTAEIPLDDFGWIDPIGTSIHEGPNQSGSASQVPAADDVPNNDDQLLDYEVAGSSSCEPLNPSLDSLSNDLSPTPSTTEHFNEGPNQSSSASQMPPTSNAATGDDGLLNFKVTNTSYCNPFSSSLDSGSNEPMGTNTVDTGVLLSHHSPFSQMPPIYEANTDYQKNPQFVGNMGDFMSSCDLNYTNSSSCKYLPLSLDFLSSDPPGTTAVDFPEPLNFSQMDPADNEANNNEENIVARGKGKASESEAL